MALGIGVFVDHESADTQRLRLDAPSNVVIPLGLSLGRRRQPTVCSSAAPFMLQGAGSPKFDNGGAGSPFYGASGVNHTTLGIYLDDYPMAESGFHFGGLLGLSGMGKSGDRIGSNDPTPGGFSIAAHGGFEWWVGADWGMGVMARVLFSGLSADRKDVNNNQFTDHHAVWIPTILYTVTYN